MENRKQNTALIFLLGTFVSSLGSQTFQISLMAFMKLAGYSLGQIGLIVGSTRLVGLFTNLLLGDLADRLQARSVVLVSEVLAASLALGLAVSWRQGSQGFWLFFAICLVRSFVLSLQQPGRSKISKLLSADDYRSNSRQAIWLNKATHGSMFFAAGFSLLAITFFNFYWALAFDAFTFLVNGVILWRLRLEQSTASSSDKRNSLTRKFVDLYRYNGKLAVLDLLLAVALCGGNLFTIRFAGERESWIPIYLTSYGMAVWVTGYLERVEWIRKQHALYWVGFGVSFILLARFPGLGLKTFLLFMLNDHCYWLLFHRYSSHIQARTPTARMAAVSSARMIQMILVLALGEFLVGSWQSVVPIFWEGAWRAIFCFLVAAGLVLNVGGSRVLHEEKAAI